MLSVIIVGGGYGGAYTARRLGRHAQVTLVSRDNFLLFTPMLAEVAAADIEPGHIIAPLRHLCPRARIVVGEVVAIDTSERWVDVQPEIGGRPRRVEADHLVIAAGSVSRDFGIAGVAEHAHQFKTIAEAIAIRRRLLASLEAAAESRDDALTRVAVVGAGYSGAEAAASIADFLRSAIDKYYPEAPAAHVTLVDAIDRVTPTLPARLSAAAAEALRARGVDLMLGKRVASVEADGLTLDNGERIVASTVVWAAGVQANPLAAASGLPLRDGRIIVDGRCVAAPNVYAVGDIASVPDGHGGICPPTAQHALRQGRYLGRTLPRLALGLDPKPFSYRTKGQLVSLGHHNAVGLVFGLPVSGIVAWFLWRTYYWWRLPTILRKIRVAIDWTLDAAFPPDIASVPLERSAKD